MGMKYFSMSIFRDSHLMSRPYIRKEAAMEPMKITTMRIDIRFADRWSRKIAPISAREATIRTNITRRLKTVAPIRKSTVLVRLFMFVASFRR
jgi:hypothetical protein